MNGLIAELLMNVNVKPCFDKNQESHTLTFKATPNICSRPHFKKNSALKIKPYFHPKLAEGSGYFVSIRLWIGGLLV